jgi:hypothetical protein
LCLDESSDNQGISQAVMGGHRNNLQPTQVLSVVCIHMAMQYRRKVLLQFSVNENKAVGDEIEFITAFQAFPTLGRTLGQFEHQGKGLIPLTIA